MKPKLLICTPIKNIKGLYEKLNKFFTLTYKPIASENQLKNLNQFDYIFTNPNMSKIKFDKFFLIKCEKLKAICTASTGTNHIDLQYMKDNKIRLIYLRNNKKVINKISSTAEHAFALMMSTVRHINTSAMSIRKKKWEYLPYVGRQMNFLTVGVVGYGRLGKMFVRLLKGFDPKILIYEKKFKIRDYNKKYQTGLNELLRKSDIIALHIHADKENINFIDKKKLRIAKKNLIIINTSRGEVVNEVDIINFLKKNKSAKYSTDVVKNEIKGKWESKILKEFLKGNKNILITPHIGGMTDDAQFLAYHAAANDLIKIL
jgi:lactate dehydrogenase-like 2-hydroxyacid dehydrogenase